MIAPTRVAAVVLAAGEGQRFGAHKQFALLAGTRLVDRAVALVKQVCSSVVLVLPAGVEWDGPAVDRVAIGGKSRSESLRNAVAALPADERTVVIHDPARPLVTDRTLHALIEAITRGADAAMPVWPSPDMIKRRAADATLEHVGREGYVIAASPSACRLSALRAALERFDGDFPDETAVIAANGGNIVGVPGDRWSHHVVDGRDLRLIEKLIDSV